MLPKLTLLLSVAALVLALAVPGLFAAAGAMIVARRLGVPWARSLGMVAADVWMGRC